MTKTMNGTYELDRNSIRIDRDMEVDSDIGKEIHVYIETWFDVDRKFGTDTASDDDTWLNMYGFYNPFDDTLRIECVIDTGDDKSSCFDYAPTENEAKLIKEMIAEKIREEFHQSPEEFCRETWWAGAEDESEWNGAEMVEVTIYCDTTGYFSEAECVSDNLCEMKFPRQIVKDYFMQQRGESSEGDFDKWLNDECTADETDGLFDYAKQRGFTPRI